jgi:hypothetical protein
MRTARGACSAAFALPRSSTDFVVVVVVVVVGCSPCVLEGL